jgi:rhodanese-related sulfurtransferase
MRDQNFYFYTGLIGMFYTMFATSRYYSLGGVYLITSTDAKEKIRNGVITHVVDVRTEMEWKMGHHPLATHIPVSDLTKKTIQNSNIYINEGILIYCNSGQRARYASELLAKYGYKKVFYIDGTYNDIM